MSRVFLIQGDAGTGKSTFSLSSESKTRFYEWDTGSYERTAVEKPDVQVYQYKSPLTNLEGPGRISVGSGGGIAPSTVHQLTGWKEAFWQFVADYIEGCKSDATTLVIDTSTRLWLACRQSFLQEVQEATGQEKERLSQLQYTESNARMNQIVEAAKASGKDLILIAHEKEQWLNDKPTGVMVADSYKELPNLADCSLRFKLKNKAPLAEIYKAGTGGLQLLGMQIPEPTLESVNQLLDAAHKLRRAGKEVPSDYEAVLVEAMKVR